AAKHCLTNVNLNNIRYIASDEFTNETLIAYVLNYIMKDRLLPQLFVRHYIGAICPDDCADIYGLNIMEYCDLGVLDNINTSNDYFTQYIKEYNINNEFIEFLLDPEIIFHIFAQITVGIHMLQSYTAFISGDLKAGNVFIKSDPIDMMYQGIKLHADFTCKIADYGKSSCMLPRTDGTSLRFFTESFLSNVYLKIHPFEPDVTRAAGEYYYTIGNLLDVQLYTRIRHAGVPFYRSFDYYTVLVSILTIPVFHYMFFATERLLQTFWDPVWIDEDGEEAIDRIK